MAHRHSWIASAALLLTLAVSVSAQMGGGMMGPGMMGGGMMGPGMMGGGMGMGQQQASTPKWVSPLVPLCWAVGRSPYPGIACLYASAEQRAQLEALVKEVAPSIEGRFWVKFSDVTADTEPPGFIKEILSPELRDPKGGGNASGGGMMGGGAGGGMMGGGMGGGGMMGGGMGGPGGGGMMGGGMGGASQGSEVDPKVAIAARRTAPAIVIFGRDIFSQPGASSGGQQGGGGAGRGGMMGGGGGAPMMGGGGMMGGGMGGGMMGGGMGGQGTGGPGMMGGGAGASDSLWAQMDHNFMIYWSFVGQKEFPNAEMLRHVLDSVGDPKGGIDRQARYLRLDKQNPQLTLALGQAYVNALEGARRFLPQLSLDRDPSRARMMQQNQYIADYMLARAESLPGGVTLTGTIRTEQKRLAPSFRYAAPTSLTPLMCTNFPGLVGLYRDPSQRLRLERTLDDPAVQRALQAGGYWCQLTQVVDDPGDSEAAAGIIAMIKDAALDTEINSYPAVLLCGQDIFADPKQEQEVVQLAGGSSGGGMGGGMMGGGMGGPGGGGMMGGGMGGPGMMGGGAGRGAGDGTGSAAAGKPTDWLVASGGASSSTGGGMGGGGMMGGPGGGGGGMMGGGAGMMGGGMMGGGMMGGGAGGGGMMGGMGGGSSLTLAAINWSDYDYRMPARMANLMLYGVYKGAEGPRALPAPENAAALADTLGLAAAVDTASRAIKVDDKHDDIPRLLDVARAYINLHRHYMADYFLARAEKTLAAEQEKVREFENRLKADSFLPADQRRAMRERFASRITQMDSYRPALRELRGQILTDFAIEEATNQVPVLLREYPGIVVFYEGDGNLNPDIPDDPNAALQAQVPSRQRAYIQSILSQPHIAAVIRDKFWIKYVRVDKDIEARDLGLDARPSFVNELPAVVVLGPDIFADPQVTGGTGTDDTAVASTGGATAGRGAAGGGMGGPGMMGGGAGGGMGGPGMMGGGAGGGMMGGMGGGAASGSGGDPAGWLPMAGGGSSSGGAGGGMMGGGMGGGGMMGGPGGGGGGMMGGGMGGPGGGMGGGMMGGGMGGGASQSDGPPVPTGIIIGTSPADGQYAQWVNYEHPNQMGLHSGSAMIHWAYVGRKGLPAVTTTQPPAAPSFFTADARARALDLTWQLAGARARVEALRNDQPAVDLYDPQAAAQTARLADDAEKSATTLHDQLSALVKAETDRASRRSDYVAQVDKWAGDVANAWYQDPFSRRLQRAYIVSEVGRRVYAEQQAFDRDQKAGVAEADLQYPDGQLVLDLAREYVSLPGGYMAEYMLARSEYLLDKGWTPDDDTLEVALSRALAEQALGADHAGTDYLPTLAAFLKKDPDAKLSESAWSRGATPRVILAAATSLRRLGELPTFSASQYITAEPASDAGEFTNTAVTTGWGDALTSRVPGFFQQPPATLSDAQLIAARTGLVQAIETGTDPSSGRIAWSRLLGIELELRDRAKVEGFNRDASWSQLMALWKRRPMASGGYQEALSAATSAAAQGEINALRAIYLVDSELQQKLNADEPRRAELILNQTVEQVAGLRDYLNRNPYGRVAQQARYMLGSILELGALAGNTEPQLSAAQEQNAALKPVANKPYWWRWESGRWERFQSL